MDKVSEEATRMLRGKNVSIPQGWEYPHEKGHYKALSVKDGDDALSSSVGF